MLGHRAQVKGTCVRRHSQQGSVKPLTIIDSPADWTSASLKGREAEFTYALSDAEVAELISAVDALKRRGVSSEQDVLQVHQRCCCVNLTCSSRAGC